MISARRIHAPSTAQVSVDAALAGVTRGQVGDVSHTGAVHHVDAGLFCGIQQRGMINKVVFHAMAVWKILQRRNVIFYDAHT